MENQSEINDYYDAKDKKRIEDLVKMGKTFMNTLYLILGLATLVVFCPICPAVFLITGKATTFEWVWFAISIVLTIIFTYSMYASASLIDHLPKDTMDE